MNKVKKLVKARLSNLRNEERNDAITMLLLLGLKHYSIVCNNQQLQLSQLKALCDTYVMELERQMYQNESELDDAFKYERQLVLAAEQRRKSRPDSMAHFPFADEHGSMGDVLSGQAAWPEIDLDSMGLAGRNRLIERVFEEMRLDHQGIRLSDLPMALELLGIFVSAKLRHTLGRARGKNVNGPLIPLDNTGDDGHWAWKGTEYVEKHVPLTLWKSIVKNFLRLRRQGVNPHYLDEVLPGQHKYPHTQHETSSDRSDEERNEGHSLNEGEEPSNETKHHSERESNREFGIQRPTASSRHRQNSPHKRPNANPVNARSKAYFHRLHNVPSRLGEVIRKDRTNFQQTERKDERAALSAVARQRVDVLTSHGGPSLRLHDNFGANDSNGSSSANLRRHGLVRDPGTGRIVLASQKDTQRLVSRLHDLSSGSATLEIADAFLKGRVGRELLLTQQDGAAGRQYEDYFGPDNDDDDGEDLTPLEAETRAKSLLGLQPQVLSRTKSSNEPKIEYPSQEKSGPQLGHGFRTLREKITERILDEEAKHLYASMGWKGSKGGWVADFGPTHTHSKYTGPDQYHAFLHERQQSSHLARSHRNGTRAQIVTDKTDYMDDILQAMTEDPYTSGAKPVSGSLNRNSERTLSNSDDNENTNVTTIVSQSPSQQRRQSSEQAPKTGKVLQSTKSPQAREDSDIGLQTAQQSKTWQPAQSPGSSAGVSSEDAALHFAAGLAYNDDVYLGEGYEEDDVDVDALLTRLQTSVSLKDIVASDEE